MQRIWLDITIGRGRKRVVKYDQLGYFKLAKYRIITVYGPFELHKLLKLLYFSFRINIGVFACDFAGYADFQITATDKFLSGVIPSLYRSQQYIVFA